MFDSYSSCTPVTGPGRRAKPSAKLPVSPCSNFDISRKPLKPFLNILNPLVTPKLFDLRITRPSTAPKLFNSIFTPCGHLLRRLEIQRIGLGDFAGLLTSAMPHLEYLDIVGSALVVGSNRLATFRGPLALPSIPSELWRCTMPPTSRAKPQRGDCHNSPASVSRITQCLATSFASFVASWSPPAFGIYAHNDPSGRHPK